MGSLTQLRCHNHAEREAAALCSKCRKPHCRECVTEHDGRVLCTGCLAQSAQTSKRRFRFAPILASTLAFSVSLIALGAIFGLLGKTLLNFPSVLHEGTIWQGAPMP
ncbi:MAG: hypothetical protein QM784_23065 [Polyangiaceae bacterium]